MYILNYVGFLFKKMKIQQRKKVYPLFSFYYYKTIHVKTIIYTGGVRGGCWTFARDF